MILGAVLVAPGWSGLFADPWATRLGWIGTGFIALGSWFQYNASKPFEKVYSMADWSVVGNKAKIVLGLKDHKKGRAAQGEIYAKNEHGGYHACMAGVDHRDGEITFNSSGGGFDCKVVIR